MLPTLLFLLPLLASTSAQPHQQSSNAERDLPPLDIYNNALLSERSVSHSQAAKRHLEMMSRQQNAPVGHEGQKMKLVRRMKKRACKAASPTGSSSTVSVIGQGAVATGGANASVTGSPSSSTASPSSTATDSEAWSQYTSAYASASAAAASGTSPSASSAVHSTSSSSAAPAQSSSSGGSSGSSTLFPVGRGTASWTTDPNESGALSLNDALKPLSAGKLPAQGTAPDGSTALVANFPAGTVKLASGQGFSFYTEGSKNGVYVPGAKEVVFSYSAFFEDGFQFAKGGKMPGFFGGTSFETAKSCSGGKQDGRDECFSARLMWRKDGMGEAYNYYPTSVTQGNNYCQTAPMSVCDADYGDSIGRGSFYWGSGSWTTVAQRLKLNDAGQANGEQEIFVNGKSVLHLTGLQIATNANTKIWGIMAQTFFGGSDSSWASPRDQNIWFKDFSMAVIS